MQDKAGKNWTSLLTTDLLRTTKIFVKRTKLLGIMVDGRFLILH